MTDRSIRVVAPLLLVASVLALSWPVAWSGRRGLAEAADQRTHHEPAIRGFVAQWPRLNLVDYPSATTPGYHVVMAAVARFVTPDRRQLQLINGAWAVALLLVLYFRLARELEPLQSLALLSPLAASSYVLAAAIWLVTDDAGLLFAALALGVCTVTAPEPRRIAGYALAAGAAVSVRQVHLFVMAPVLLATAALWPGAARRLGASVREDRAAGPAPLERILLAASLGLPFLVLGAFAALWGGLVPPGLADRHAGFRPGALPVSLALTGVFGVFFLPWLAASPRQWLPRGLRDWRWILLGAASAIAVPTGYERSLGRRGGPFWELVRVTPELLDRALVSVLLAGLGAWILVLAARAGRANGRGWNVTLVLVAAASFVAVQSASAILFQKYFEPMLLIFLLMLVALAGKTARAPLAFLGPLTLGALQLTLSLTKLYR